LVHEGLNLTFGRLRQPNVEDAAELPASTVTSTTPKPEASWVGVAAHTTLMKIAAIAVIGTTAIPGPVLVPHQSNILHFTSGDYRSESATTGPDSARGALSATFLQSLNRLANLPPGWDGFRAAAISLPTVSTAWAAAESAMKRTGGEPALAPGADGSLLLQWKLADGTIIETFVIDNEIEPAAVTRHGVSYEEPTRTIGDLTSLLERHVLSAEALV